MAKQAGRCESCCGGLCGAEAFESCCEAFEGFKACPKRATRQFRSQGCAVLRPSNCKAFEGFKACPKRATRQLRSPIETAFGANREAPWQSKRNASRAAAEGCAVLRPSKAAARFLRV